MGVGVLVERKRGMMFFGAVIGTRYAAVRRGLEKRWMVRVYGSPHVGQTGWA